MDINNSNKFNEFNDLFSEKDKFLIYLFNLLVKEMTRYSNWLIEATIKISNIYLDLCSNTAYLYTYIYLSYEKD